MKLNAVQILLDAHDADSAALQCGTERRSYGELRDEVARYAAVLSDLGLVPGDRVAIRLPDGIGWVSAFLGVIWAAGVAAGVNPRLRGQQWRKLLDEAQFRFVLAEPDDDLPADYRQCLIGPDQLSRSAANATAMAARCGSEDEPAFWTYSSGTSGTPKAVVHAHRCALHVERTTVTCLGVRAEDRLFASSKLFFCYPLANSLLAGLKIGATVILDPSWPSPQALTAIVQAQRPTVLFSVPSLYRDLLRDGCASAIAASGVRCCVSAGEALPGALRRAWHEQTGMVIIDGYGASETLTLAMVDCDGESDLTPSPGVDVQALGTVADGSPMRIGIRTPTLALGYWRRPDAEAQCFRGNAYYPADLFFQRAAGVWRFAGREDSLVKISGRWVDLLELEQSLGTCPDVVEAAAVSVPDDDGVSSVALFYVARTDASKQAGAALRACTDALPPHLQPRWLHPVDSLPRTATGKLLRRELADLHQQIV